MNIITLTHIHDSGHGWIKAPLDLVYALGITPSRYSYFDHEHAYLEEDCDAPRFLRALTAHALDHRIRSVYHHGDSPIRSLRRFHPAPAQQSLI